MTKEKNKIKLMINNKLARQIACQLVNAFRDYPVEDYETIINGLMVAVFRLAKDLKEYEAESGMVERMILSWFEASDTLQGTEFTKYIHLEKHDTIIENASLN